MYNHNKAQQSKNRVHIFWDILYIQGLNVVIAVSADVQAHDSIGPSTCMGLTTNLDMISLTL